MENCRVPRTENRKSKIGKLCTIQCSTVQYSIVQYSTVKYSTIQCSTVQYSTVQYSIVQCNSIQYNSVQYSTVQFSTVQYDVIHDVIRFDLIWQENVNEGHDLGFISTLQEVEVELGTVSEFDGVVSSALAHTETFVVTVELVLATAASLPDNLCDREIIFLIPQEAGVVG